MAQCSREITTRDAMTNQWSSSPTTMNAQRSNKTRGSSHPPTGVPMDGARLGSFAQGRLDRSGRIGGGLLSQHRSEEAGCRTGPTVLTPAGTIEGLDHVIVAVEDLGTAIDNYTKLFGFEPTWLGTHTNQGSENAIYVVENTYLELLAPVGSGPIATWLEAELGKSGDGLTGLAFRTSNAEQLFQRWTDAGLEPSPPEPGEAVDQTGRRRTWKAVYIPTHRSGGITAFAIQHVDPSAIRPSDSESGATQIRRPADTVTRLDHVVVLTDDPERAIALYRDGIGLRLALDQTRPEWNARQLFFRTGGTTIEVVTKLDTKRSFEPDSNLTGSDTLWGIAWETDDLVSAHKRLAQTHGVSEPRDGRKPGTSVFTVKDRTNGVATLMIEN